MRTIDANLFIENKSFVQIRIGQFSTLLLDDLNMLQIGRSFQSKDGGDGEFCEVVFIRCEDF